MTSGKKRYIAVDILKIVFAYLIMINHIILQYGISNAVAKLISYGIAMVAVPYFFASSGYFLFESVHRNLPEKKMILKRYIQKTFVIYLIWSALMLPFKIPEIMQTGLHLKNQAVFWAKYFRIFLFIGDYQLWYLIGLIWAVILFTLCFKNNRLKPCVIAMGILYLIRILIECFPQIINSNVISANLLRAYMIVFGTTRNGIFVGFIYLMLGVLLAKYKEKLKLFQMETPPYIYIYIYRHSRDICHRIPYAPCRV